MLKRCSSLGSRRRGPVERIDRDRSGCGACRIWRDLHGGNHAGVGLNREGGELAGPGIGDVKISDRGVHDYRTRSATGRERRAHGS